MNDDSKGMPLQLRALENAKVNHLKNKIQSF